VYLRFRERRGHVYYSVVEGRRSADRIRQRNLLTLGSLEDLSQERRRDLEQKVAALHNPKVLHAFYAKLAEFGHPVPSYLPPPDLVAEGPFPLRSVDFATLTEALRQDDLTSHDLAALVSRIGLPLRPDELVALGLRVESEKKTRRSISLYYRRTSRPPRRPAPPAAGTSRPRRRSDVGSVRSVQP